jgi:ubiquinone/menaquinone biosynthesis C-methylase UbiE
MIGGQLKETIKNMIFSEQNFWKFFLYPIINVAKYFLNLILNVVWSILDASETFLGKRDPLVPPRRLMSVGSNQLTRSDFNKIGQELFQYLVEIGGLKPNDNVLDVGCGVGRMAIPLTRYLSAQGTYAGFDIVAESIQHCVQSISPHFPNFHFHHADLFNAHYNPDGKCSPHQHKFPFPNETFSFVFLTSVFTHMLSKDMENYLNEICRVLTIGGRCFITYFLLTPESEEMIRSNRSTKKFVFPVDYGKSIKKHNLEAAVAFNESYIRELYSKCGLRIIAPIRYGSWCERNTDAGYQDIVVGVK